MGTEDREKAHYKIPLPGDQVKVTGMSNRPQLNGAHAEVMSSGADDEGFLVGRLIEGGPEGSRRRMKVRPSRLAPLGPRSSSSSTSGRLLRPLIHRQCIQLQIVGIR